MSWLFSQALVEEYLPESSLVGEQSAPLNGKPTQQAYCAPDKMTGFSRLSRFGMTFKPLMEIRGEELLMSYLEDFRAKTSQPQEKAQELMESEAGCGEKWRGSFVKYDPDTSSWKTPQCSLLGDSEEFLETWPQWGLMRNGECWEQRMLERTIRGTESGLSERLPTPQSSDHITKKTSASWKAKGGVNFSLANPEIQKKWLTPTSHNAKETNAPSESKRNTPTLAAQAGGKLNPDWVEWLMNWPIKWSNLNGFNKQEFQRWQEASAKAIQNVGQMRTMWWDSDPSQTPFGQQPLEQSRQQHCDSLPEMPRDASCERKMERSQQRSDLSLLREDVYIQETEGKNLQSGMWEQTGLDKAEVIPRVSQSIVAKADRLKAIGNGQVPLCAATAWRILNEPN